MITVKPLRALQYLSFRPRTFLGIFAMSAKKIVDTFNQIDAEMVYVKNKLDSLNASLAGSQHADSSGNALQKMQEENKAIQREMLEIIKQITVYDLLEGKSPLVLKVFMQGQHAKQASLVAAAQPASNHAAPLQQHASVAPAEAPAQKPESQPDSKKQKGKGKDAPSKAEDAAPADADPPAESKKGKDKKAEKVKEVAPSGAGDTQKNEAAASADDAVTVAKLDFRVGKIVEVRKHPDADSLYVEQIDLGEGKPRTIVSGLVKHVPIEEMKDRMVVVLCNLKPAKMRGVLSEGMVMCASTPEKVEILVPPSGAQPGDRVSFDGYPGTPDKELNPKKKIWETLAPELSVDSNKTAVYKNNVAFVVSGKGPVTSPSLTGCPVK